MTPDDDADPFSRIQAFDWDENKREQNLQDHGIDFQDARQVTDGPTFVRRSDRKGEIRYMVFGFLDDKEIVVICTFRGEICRLISARRARQDERKKYHSGLPRRPDAG
jgi:uncharacterized DUF497 family protein